MEFCPAFWDWLIEANQKGTVASIAEVRAELLAKKDELSQWVANHGNFFLWSDDRVHETAWRLSQKKLWGLYGRDVVDRFMNSADYWLISHAMAYGYVVVTQEVPANTKKKVKIPNICKEFNVPWVNTFQMLRNENPKFVLKRELEF